MISIIKIWVLSIIKSSTMVRVCVRLLSKDTFLEVELFSIERTISKLRCVLPTYPLAAVDQFKLPSLSSNYFRVFHHILTLDVIILLNLCLFPRQRKMSIHFHLFPYTWPLRGFHVCRQFNLQIYVKNLWAFSVEPQPLDDDPKYMKPTR